MGDAEEAADDVKDASLYTYDLDEVVEVLLKPSLGGTWQRCSIISVEDQKNVYLVRMIDREVFDTMPGWKEDETIEIYVRADRLRKLSTGNMCLGARVSMPV